MKRFFLYAALCAAVITSCEKKEVTPEVGENQVSFVIDGPMTRVSTVGNVSTFETGDKVSITSKGLYKDITNEVYTVGAQNLVGKTVYFGKEDASFVAHYPANLVNENGTITMTVAADQDSDEDFHNNMFMVATATGNADKGYVSLAFTHKLAMVKVYIEGLDNAKSVTISNIAPKITWTATELATATAEETIDVAAWKQANKQEYWALVPAQTLKAETKLITIADDAGKKYEYVLGSDITFTTGKVKTLNLTFRGSLTEVDFPVLDNVTWEDEGSIEDIFDIVEGEEVTPVAGIALDKTEAELKVDETLTLKATVTPDDATDKTVTWTSDKPEIATVVNGVVTAKAAGTAVITATAGEKSATCTVTVKEKVYPVESVVLNQETATLNIGKTVTLTADVKPENATDKTVVWTSDEPKVATVENGVVTAKAAGKAVITATAGNVSATCTVTVIEDVQLVPVTGITLNQETATLNAGETVTLTATVTPDNAFNKTVTWSSNKPEIATVENGVVTAKAAGTATITATAGEFSATCTVTVNEEPEVDAPLELISAETGDFSELTEFASTPMTNYSNLTVNKWNIGSKASVEVINNEVAITIKDGTNARYNRGIGFRTDAIPSDVTTLTLSFTAYCSAANQNLCIAAMQAEASNTAFKIDDNNSYQTPTLNITSTDYTYTIDLSSPSVTGGDYTGGIVIMLAPGNANGNLQAGNTWYVSNVRLIEKVTE